MLVKCIVAPEFGSGRLITTPQEIYASTTLSLDLIPSLKKVGPVVHLVSHQALNTRPHDNLSIEF